MPKLNFHLHQNFRRDLRSALKNHLADVLRQVRYPDSGHADDPDLNALWQEGLRESLRADCGFLQQFVERPEFGNGVIEVNEEHAEHIMRAASGLRLFLRVSVFAELSDSTLEQAADVLETLESEEKKFYFSIYIFLAGLQQFLVASLLHPEGGP